MDNVPCKAFDASFSKNITKMQNIVTVATIQVFESAEQVWVSYKQPLCWNSLHTFAV